MLEDDILNVLSEKKSLEDIASEISASKKKLKIKLRSMVQEGVIESDGEHYWKGKEGKPARARINYLPIALLALIVLLGFVLRIYHIDYPVIGYHNWKETHYLTEARNFAREGFFKYGIFVPAWDYPFLKADPSGAHSDTFPSTSIIVALFYMIVGPQLWAARLTGILFNTATIVMTYLVVKRLFKREDIALVSALLTATLPLFVFFSHNVDLINPGLFFMMASAYFYLRWRESYKGTEMVATVLSLTLAGLTKYPFLVIAIPMFLSFILPYLVGFIQAIWKSGADAVSTFPSGLLRENLPEIKKQAPYLLVSLLILSAIPAWFIYSEEIIGNKYGTMAYTLSEGGMIKLEVLSDPQWWEMQKSYVRDNYTMTGLLFAIFGAAVLALIFAMHLFKRNVHLTPGDYFVFFYLLAAAPFLTVMSYKLGGHSYHQYPIAPLIVMLIAYFAIRLGDGAKYLIKQKDSGYVAGLAMIVIVLSFFVIPWGGVLFPSSSPACAAGFCEAFAASISRQFDTQFIGLDVAGEYIKSHSGPDERILFPSHQSYGVLWHADRKGYKMPDTVADINDAEAKGAQWIFVYQWGFSVAQDKERWDYITSHYSIKQAAFIKTDQGLQPVYFLFKKGGSFDPGILNTISTRKINTRNYEYSVGLQPLYYVNFEE